MKVTENNQIENWRKNIQKKKKRKMRQEMRGMLREKNLPKQLGMNLEDKR